MRMLRTFIRDKCYLLYDTKLSIDVYFMLTSPMFVDVYKCERKNILKKMQSKVFMLEMMTS